MTKPKPFLCKAIDRDEPWALLRAKANGGPIKYYVMNGCSWLTPDEARDFGEWLIKCADYACKEGGRD